MSSDRLGRLVGCVVVVMVIGGAFTVFAIMKRQLMRIRAAQDAAEAPVAPPVAPVQPEAPPRPLPAARPASHGNEKDKPKLPPGAIW